MYVYTYFHIVWNNSLEIKIHFLCKEVWLKKWRGVPPPRYKKVQFKKNYYIHAPVKFSSLNFPRGSIIYYMYDVVMDQVKMCKYISK